MIIRVIIEHRMGRQVEIEFISSMQEHDKISLKIKTEVVSIYANYELIRLQCGNNTISCYGF